MAFFRKKPVVIEAITFNEFVEYGINNGANIVNGMPWSFNYKGITVTHENDALYLLSISGSVFPLHFTPTDVLITGIEGVSVCNEELFEKTYISA